MQCKICNQDNAFIFKAQILNKYDIQYYYCQNCGFLQTEEAYWIEEAYSESINISDTGVISRNLNLSQLTTLVIYIFFDKNKKFLDFAGGYGIFTRIMRDIGFDYYWNDKYSTNLVARGFEYNNNDTIELLTSFESFEHFDNPIGEIENMLQISKNILLTTNLIPDTPPNPTDWWYYGLEHGQHISFYHLKTLKFIANKYDLNLYTNGSTFHLLTEKKLNDILFQVIFKLNRLGLFKIINRLMKSKTTSDMNHIIKGLKNESTL